MGKVQYHVTESGEIEIKGNVSLCLGEVEEEETPEDEDAVLRSYLPDVPEETIRQIILYRDTFPVVGPYKIDFRPNIPMLDAVLPISSENSPQEYELAMSSLEFSIDQYNKDKASKLEVAKVVRVNMRAVTGFLFYITFEATDKDIYCTQVWDNVVEDQVTVIEFFKENNEVKDAAHVVSSTKRFKTS